MSQPLPPDNHIAIAAGITLAVVGISFFMALPVIVGAWSEYAGFSEQQAGFLAAMENSGTVAASLFVSFALNRFNRRKLAVGAILIAVTANLASIQVVGFYPTALCRILAGFGSGTLYALGLATLAATQHTSRNFSILLFLQVSFGMAEINFFTWLVDEAGMNGIYLSMALALTTCLGIIHWIPQSVQKQTIFVGSDSASHGLLPLACLFAVFLFYIGVSAFWTYVERMGNSAGLDSALVTGSLTYTQALSLLGCIIASWLSRKFGQFRPLILSLACIAGACYGLTLGIDNFSFVTTLCVFFLCWNAIDIYQLGTLGNLDHGGKFVALVPAFQAPATALGPALSAVLLGSTGNYNLVLLLVASTTTAAAVIYGFSYLWLRTYNPEVADAE